jgi:NAD(P)-dependent dehydrogenase (short-subunit alcohol dehydrogenase family)
MPPESQADQRQLGGKIVLVTGAAHGIGAAIAVGCHQAGATVIAIDKDDAPPHGDNISLCVDVTDTAAVAAALPAIVDRYGRIDCLVNNAGISRPATIENLTPDTWDEVQAVNVKSAALLIQAVLPYMGPGSTIVNISSIRARLGFSGDAAYLASKGALESLTRGLAIELAGRRIRVNAVAPGAVETDLNRAALRDTGARNGVIEKIPLGRLGEPADIAGAVVYLASDAASFVTGTTLTIDGGQSIRG